MTQASRRPPRAKQPAFIRRLPEGIDYTQVKAICLDLPSALTALLWSTLSRNDDVLAAFKGRTIRAIDRAIRREEQAQRNPRETAAIRHELVDLALYETNALSSPRPDRRVSITHVFPQVSDNGDQRPGPSVPYVRMTIGCVEPRQRRGRRAVQAPTMLEERVITSEPAAWDPSIQLIDPDAVDRAVLELVRRHFPHVMGIRVGARWRSNYSPEGWKLVTQHLVPRLFEYLRPFYSVRRYRRAGRHGPGQYPVRLRRDITDIIRFELPYVARGLTGARVTAAIQRFTARQHLTRRRIKRNRPKQ